MGTVCVRTCCLDVELSESPFPPREDVGTRALKMLDLEDAFLRCCGRAGAASPAIAADIAATLVSYTGREVFNVMIYRA